MPNITNRSLQSVRPKSKPLFIRDTKVKGFAAKVNPSGSIKLIAEVRHEKRTVRKTIGEYPGISLQDARAQTITFIQQVRTGKHREVTKKEVPLYDLFQRYLLTVDLKQNTRKNYRQVIGFYLQDWLEIPVSSISREMVEKRFYKIRDKGIAGGKPTYSQATKVMRILSALMNYAIGDEQIESNPVDVLRLKKVDRSTRKRTSYLKASEAHHLLKRTEGDNHPVTQAIRLMLYTGMRKNEALRLRWSDLVDAEGISCLLIRDPKNGRDHYVPVSSHVNEVLQKAKNSTEHIFPSTQKKGACISDVRPTLSRLHDLTGLTFRCHDLRRTFATRATEVGIDYLMVKRLLNHKSNDITAQYIQWHSRENLLMMRESLERITY
ncbi:tyrosine-type recombinase/integrase [Desulfosediminicola ganghwensis]|uniref:tyrosine-type recombinase/integrase n=1 Tax=Desulfosediminicola ganghwensis TaxID=2569540 RepID=UPI0010AD7D93|nr:tyrosine-type recombinase/integrase [Desulfosediminicola ganghwensis]